MRGPPRASRCPARLATPAHAMSKLPPSPPPVCYGLCRSPPPPPPRTAPHTLAHTYSGPWRLGHCCVRRDGGRGAPPGVRALHPRVHPGPRGHLRGPAGRWRCVAGRPLVLRVCTNAPVPLPLLSPTAPTHTGTHTLGTPPLPAWWQAGSYKVTLDTSNRDSLRSLTAAGEYGIEIVVGDFAMDKAIVWKVGSVSLTPPPPPVKPEEVSSGPSAQRVVVDPPHARALPTHTRVQAPIPSPLPPPPPPPHPLHTHTHQHGRAIRRRVHAPCPTGCCVGEGARTSRHVPSASVSPTPLATHVHTHTLPPAVVPTPPRRSCTPSPCCTTATRP